LDEAGGMGLDDMVKVFEMALGKNGCVVVNPQKCP
jgi:hypothetical protein